MSTLVSATVSQTRLPSWPTRRWQRLRCSNQRRDRPQRVKLFGHSFPLVMLLSIHCKRLQPERVCLMAVAICRSTTEHSRRGCSGNSRTCISTIAAPNYRWENTHESDPFGQCRPLMHCTDRLILPVQFLDAIPPTILEAISHALHKHKAVPNDLLDDRFSLSQMLFCESYR